VYLLAAQALVPPSAIPQVNKWLVESKGLPPPRPRSEWGRVQIPLHQELVDMTEQGIGRELPANATAAAAPAAEAAAAAAPAAAKSAAGSSRVRASFAGVAAAVTAAVVLWA
jgi:hypothetical protein